MQYYDKPYKQHLPRIVSMWMKLTQKVDQFIVIESFDKH